MSVLDQIKNTVSEFISDANAFSVPATFISPSDQEAQINVLHTKHHESVDGNGLRVISKMASVAFSEIKFNELNPDYKLRNDDGNVDVTDHKVIVKDTIGEEKKYKVKFPQPDEGMLGIIVLILEDYGD